MYACIYIYMYMYVFFYAFIYLFINAFNSFSVLFERSGSLRFMYLSLRALPTRQSTRMRSTRLFEEIIMQDSAAVLMPTEKRYTHRCMQACTAAKSVGSPYHWGVSHWGGAWRQTALRHEVGDDVGGLHMRECMDICMGDKGNG